MQLWFLIGLQAFAAAFTCAGTANDFMGGLFAAMGYAMECASTCLLLRAVSMMDGAVEGADKEARLLEAISLSAMASKLLMINLFVPIGLTAYDALVVPAYRKIRQEDAGTPLEIATAILQALLLVPLQVAAGMFGFGGNAADIMETTTNLASETTIAAIRRLSIMLEGGAEVEGEAKGEEGCSNDVQLFDGNDGDGSPNAIEVTDVADVPTNSSSSLAAKRVEVLRRREPRPRHTRTALVDDERWGTPVVGTPVTPMSDGLPEHIPTSSPLPRIPPALDASPLMPGLAERARVVAAGDTHCFAAPLSSKALSCGGSGRWSEAYALT